MNKKILAIIILIVGIFLIVYGVKTFTNKDVVTPLPIVTENPVATTTSTSVYKNDTYGFTLNLENDWTGYTVSTGTVQLGYSVTLRHPQWTKENPRMDIPVLVYPIEQWEKWAKTDFEGYVTAAPMGPTERGRNAKFVFATAPRYNFSFLPGFEEVEKIVTTLKGI